MTQMKDGEKRFNLLFAIGLTVIGLLLWAFGALAVDRNFLLPDYASALQGCGGVAGLTGLIWLMLATLRSEAATLNLSTSFILALGALALWLASFSSSPLAGSLRTGGRNALIACGLWLILAVGKLIVTTPAKK